MAKQKTNKAPEQVNTLKAIYVSGGISGRPEEEYKKHFSAAAAKLSAKGYEVVNPLYNDVPSDAAWETHMRADIRLLTFCDEIYMLAGWERSAGATAEHTIAKALGMVIQYETPLKNQELKQAILTALGIDFKQVCQKGRHRPTVYARFIYAHHAHQNGDSIITIAKEMNHKHSNVSYYVRRYDVELKYNREFRTAAKAVNDLLNIYRNTP
jgi:Asp-tRNA(Asn)/Glu-tRNA(Gln) amidotransferase A subunit family amidase